MSLKELSERHFAKLRKHNETQAKRRDTLATKWKSAHGIASAGNDGESTVQGDVGAEGGKSTGSKEAKLESKKAEGLQRKASIESWKKALHGHRAAIGASELAEEPAPSQAWTASANMGQTALQVRLSITEEAIASARTCSVSDEVLQNLTREKEDLEKALQQIAVKPLDVVMEPAERNPEPGVEVIEVAEEGSASKGDKVETADEEPGAAEAATPKEAATMEPAATTEVATMEPAAEEAAASEEVTAAAGDTQMETQQDGQSLFGPLLKNPPDAEPVVQVEEEAPMGMVQTLSTLATEIARIKAMQREAAEATTKVRGASLLYTRSPEAAKLISNKLPVVKLRLIAELLGYMGLDRL